jgi:outer membrane immunogenic protein
VPAPPCCGYSETLTGWTLGAGWDFAVTSHWITRIEYRYTDYGSTSDKLKPTFPGTRMHTENTTSVIRLGAAYKF